jgi:hypothetical protein
VYWPFVEVIVMPKTVVPSLRDRQQAELGIGGATRLTQIVHPLG